MSWFVPALLAVMLCTGTACYQSVMLPLWNLRDSQIAPQTTPRTMRPGSPAPTIVNGTAKFTLETPDFGSALEHTAESTNTKVLKKGTYTQGTNPNWCILDSWCYRIATLHNGRKTAGGRGMEAIPRICSNTLARYSGSLQRLPQAVVLSRKLSNACRSKRACDHEQQSGGDRPGQVEAYTAFSQTHAVWLISYSVPRELVAYCLPHHNVGQLSADRTIREFNALPSKLPL